MARARPGTPKRSRSKADRLSTIPALPARKAANVKAGGRPTEEVALYYNRIAFAYGQQR